jgi:hypothetical protein
MADKRVLVEELAGDDVDLERVAHRVETPPVVSKPARRAMEGWKTIVMEDNDSIPPPGLFIGYNGQTYLLRAGVEAMVPPGILGILNNAVMTMPVRNPNTLQVESWRDKLRYPYRLIEKRVT